MARRKLTEAYGFKTQDIQMLLDAKITDLATLQQQLPGSVLVALDIKIVSQHDDRCSTGTDQLKEISVAVLDIRTQIPDFFHDLDQFYMQNNIGSFTIQVEKDLYAPRLGKIVTAERPDATRILLEHFLSMGHKKSILLGFNMYTKLKWIAEQCPSLAEIFSGWCDVQELVSQRSKELMPQSNDTPALHQDPGLRDTLKAMQVGGWRRQPLLHSATADAVKVLAVFSGLLSGIDFQKVTKKEGITVLCYHPGFNMRTAGNKTHKFTARIMASDGHVLPPQTPTELEKLFMHIEGLQGIGVRASSLDSALPGVKSWWVSFRNQQALDEFIKNTDGTELKIIAEAARKQRKDIAEAKKERRKAIAKAAGKEYIDIAEAAGKNYDNIPIIFEGKMLRVRACPAPGLKGAGAQRVRAPKLDDWSDVLSSLEPSSIFDITNEIRFKEASPPHYEDMSPQPDNDASPPYYRDVSPLPVEDTSSLLLAKKAALLRKQQEYLEASYLNR